MLAVDCENLNEKALCIGEYFLFAFKGDFCYLCGSKRKSMAEMKYPVGMATFSELIRKGYVYVDKTAYIDTVYYTHMTLPTNRLV